MEKFKFILFLSLITYHLSLAPAFAQTPERIQVGLAPDSPFYFLKSVREILELKFAGTTRIRALRELEFTTRRIREVSSLVNTSREDLISPTLERYLAVLNDLSGIANTKDKDLATKVSEEVVWQMTVLQEILPQVTDLAAKRSIRATIYRVTQWEQSYSTKLSLDKQPDLAQKMVDSKLSGCNLLAKEASSSALNQVERVVWAERAKICLETKPR